MHGEVLSEYKNNKEMFYSGWRAAGIGSLCCVFLLGIIFGYVYVESSTGSTGEYYDYLETFTENEEIATSLYNLLDDGNNLQVVKFIEKTALPAWRENLQIIHKISELDDLPPELKVNNELLV
ncbi:MAG: hypothetical protein HN862_04985, partial [Candidatus Scalindua sp.]|nr:hypothetical protein [Candidatus Scalindua sp.]